MAEAHANFLFRVEHNYDEALRILRLAEQNSPNDLSILVTIGNVLRRTGRLEEAVVYLRRAEALAPRDLRVIDFQFSAYRALRRYDDLERVLQRRMVLRPERETELETELELAMTRATKNNDWPSYLRELRRLDARMPDEKRASCRADAQDFAGALEALQKVQGEEVDGWPKSFLLGDLQMKLGDRAAASAAYREAEASLRKKVTEQPPPKSVNEEIRTLWLKAKLATACAVVGKSAEATRLAEEVLQREPADAEPAWSYTLAERVAEVFGLAGDMPRAIRIYRNLLEVPSGITRFQLRNGPDFGEFRKNPEFAAMVAEPGP